MVGESIPANEAYKGLETVLKARAITVLKRETVEEMRLSKGDILHYEREIGPVICGRNPGDHWHHEAGAMMDLAAMITVEYNNTHGRYVLLEYACRASNCENRVYISGPF